MGSMSIWHWAIVIVVVAALPRTEAEKEKH